MYRIYVICNLASSNKAEEVPPCEGTSTSSKPVTRQDTGSLPEPIQHMTLTEELNSENISSIFHP